MSLPHALRDRTVAGAAGSRSASAVTILLVEDECTVRKLVTRLLTLSEYRVLTAETGHDALLMWEQHRNEIDLLLTDVVLPEGPGARELADKFQAEKPGLRIVYTSGYALGFSNENDCDATEINFVHKPYRPEQLLAVVRNALESTSEPRPVC